ncbi:MAG: ribonuclease P protein component [bacterium]
MLQAENRLKKVRDFNLLVKTGKWINGQFFDLKYVKLGEIFNYFPKKEDPDSFKKQLKIAFAVSVKVSKSAVKRNSLKRKARETVRLLIKDNKVKSGYYVLLIAKKQAIAVDYAEISQEIELLFKKAQLI